MLEAKTWIRIVATNRLSFPELAWPPASPEKPIFFHDSDMADWAPTARVPASAAIPMAIPETRDVSPQHRPAARWQNPLY